MAALLANPAPSSRGMTGIGGRLISEMDLTGRDDSARSAAGGEAARSAGAYYTDPDISGQFGGAPAGVVQPQTRAQQVAALSAGAGTTNPNLTAPIMPVVGGGMPRDALDQALAGGARAANGGVVDTVDSKVEAGANQAADALGPAPQIDQGLADRQLANFDEALGMSREVIDRLLNGESQSKRIGSQVLRGQLALARSAAGGPGAVAGALRNAAFAAPEIQATATQQAISEQTGRDIAAGNVASNIAGSALGARGQDVAISAKNVEAATALMGEISRLSGVQLELDQRNQEFIGQMARDWAALDFNWAQLSQQQQIAEWDKWVEIYGIDKNFSAQMKAIAAQENIGPADMFNGIVGVIGAGAAVAATVATGGAAAPALAVAAPAVIGAVS
jgi:hypothetical protein